MSFRPPQSLIRPGFTNPSLNVLEYELQAERTAALARQGTTVEVSLAELRQSQSGEDGHREELLYRAADAVWALFIQREMCGMRNNRDIIKRYDIPEQVLARVGTVRK
jgi:hypothetical protein